MTGPVNRDALFAAAALAAAPLLWAAEDLRSGLQLGGAVAATLTVLQLLLLLTRTATAAGPFAMACGSTTAAAAASWLLAAYGLIAPELVALLPLAVANPAWWRSDGAPAVGLLLVSAPPVVGALRGVAGIAATGDGGFVAGSAAWLLSPAGLLIVAALVLALFRRRRGQAGASRRDDAAPD